MLRLRSKLASTNIPSLLLQNGRFQAKRSSSSYGKGGGAGGKIVFGVAATATSATVGAVGYCAYSDENRKSFEDLVPGSNILMNALLGPSYSDVVIPNEKDKKSKAIKIKPSTKSDDPKVEIAAPPFLSLDPPIEELLVIEQPPETENLDVLEPLFTESKEEIEDKSKTQEIIIVTPSAEEKECNKLAEILQELQKNANRSITEALSTAEEAAEAIRAHAEQAFKAINSADEKQFASVVDFADKKTELIKMAEDKINSALEKIEDLKNGISSSLESSVAKGNKEIVAAEEAIADLLYSISNIRNVIAEAITDGKAVGEYGELVDAGRKQFAAEVRSLMPDVKIGETSEKLTTDELNLLLAHAHKKVINLQRLLAKHQVLEHESVKQAIEVQRREEASLLEAKIQAELDKQAQILAVQHKQKLEEAGDEFENELRSQLKRQAAAHSDHLSDVLSVQERELESKWQLKLIEEVQSERDLFHREVSQMRGNVEGLNEALKMRADIDKQAYSARELWLACESLKTALKDAFGDSSNNLKPLNSYLDSIVKASGDNEFVKAAVSAINDEAVDRGVYTEAALKEKFIKVEQVAKKVALVKDNGGSLVRYFLSYIQNMLMINNFDSLTLEEKNDQEVLVDDLTVHDILDHAKFCLNKNDLIQAVKYMNLLRGESRHVSSDWLTEARLNLETRLIADALIAHAAATTITAI